MGTLALFAACPCHRAAHQPWRASSSSLASRSLLLLTCSPPRLPHFKERASTQSSLPCPAPPAGEKVAIKKITNVFDHVSGALLCHACLAAAAALLCPAVVRPARPACWLRRPHQLHVRPPWHIPWPPSSSPRPPSPPPPCPHPPPLHAAAAAADATRILREIKLLRLLRHPDIVEIKHIMLPPSAREFKDIYVVFELMETDLHQVRGGGWGARACAGWWGLLRPCTPRAALGGWAVDAAARCCGWLQLRQLVPAPLRGPLPHAIPARPPRSCTPLSQVAPLRSSWLRLPACLPVYCR